MEMEATVNYGDGKACFKIAKENPGVYQARLLYFEGSKKLCPPKEIVLIRGIRYWAGSHDDDDLLNKLGKIIEGFLNEAKANEEPETLVN
jgi:hypothetical protein